MVTTLEIFLDPKMTDIELEGYESPKVSVATFATLGAFL